ncbi:hypothetical protein [Paraburkholderia sp. BCC1885]|jgi:hypothetical protein|uniref:hypothetical protein n=1 Tax=Paraburkholderia sp. BCC1885 TaxID=2562669 RepID=UPI0011828678|nr:hypothetical protein [Paraburkholderia sp. BCC1885]
MLLHASLWRAATRKSACLAGIGVLSACTTVSNVDSRQDGHLTLMSRARWSLTSWTHVRSVGTKHAAAYCKAHNKQVHVVALHTTSVQGVTNEAIEVVFDCY